MVSHAPPLAHTLCTGIWDECPDICPCKMEGNHYAPTYDRATCRAQIRYAHGQGEGKGEGMIGHGVPLLLQQLHSL